MSSLENKVIVITGASSGIGEDTAKLLAGKGAKVVLAARRMERLTALVEAIQSNGGTCIAKATDVSRREDLEALIQLAISEFGRVDVLLNNAGIMPVAPMAMTKVCLLYTSPSPRDS